ncbi:MAG: GNAT family N-acetyltransferase [Anaerolineae bacterium]|nr:GNAT family N-acetyltransferase [Anaerolineae bacterium]
MYVHTEPGARQRGWGQSVVAACTERVLRDGRTPLYLVDEDNEASRALAENVGYVDTGARQVYAEVIYTGSPLDDGGWQSQTALIDVPATPARG